MLVEAMPSVMKASAEVSPRALREVDRLYENPENASGQRRQ
jgi:hypothetical protein